MIYRRSGILLLILAILWSVLESHGFCQQYRSQEASPSLTVWSSDPGANSNSLASNIGGDFWYLLKSPIRMSGNDRFAIAYLTLMNVLLVYSVDADLDREFAAAEPPNFLKPIERMADLGDLYDQIGPGYIMAGISVSLVAGGAVLKDRKLLETARLLLESSAFTGLFTHLGKGIFSRARPYTNRGARDFDFLRFRVNSRYKALPSGHVSHIFAMMTVIVKQYNKWWLKVPAYVLAGSVASQRMDDRRHWFSDVLVGGLIGYWVSSALVSRSRKPSSALPVRPYASARGLGVSIDL